MTHRNIKSENVLYRSYTPDNKLWCETWNLTELLGQTLFSKVPLTYERVVIRMVEEFEEWEDFTPTPEQFPNPEDVPGYGEDFEY